MSTNIFGRDENGNEKYQDLYASIKRIAEKSEKKEIQAKGFQNLSSNEQMKNVQDAYTEMIRKRNENI